ncbi:MAG: acyl carrier protein [Ruminococcaceae bacterium]|nr:acyl carrier protein [Oscillospiraceae bacterium]
MIEKIYEILEECCPDVDFRTEKNLVDDGLLESLDIVMIVNELAEEFDVRIGVEDILPENFNSAEAMTALVVRLQGEE